MEIPNDIRTVLCEIIELTLLTIRLDGTSKRMCAILADHAHNLPDVLKSGSKKKFFYYWEVERPGYLTILDYENLPDNKAFENLWNKLEPLYLREKNNA